MAFLTVARFLLAICVLTASVFLDPWQGLAAAQAIAGSKGESQSAARATALLRAVENARKQVEKGRLEFEDENLNETRHKRRFTVLFDGSRRHFAANAGRPGGASATVSGTNLIEFDGDSSCTLRDPANESGAYCFDPRVIGITDAYFVEDTVEKCLAYRGAKAIHFVEDQETNIDGSVHLRVIDTYGQKIDFWIEDGPPFRVHQYQFTTPAGTRRTLVNSRYDSQVSTSLPVEAIATTFDRNDRITSRRVLRLVNAEFGVEIPPSTWELAALKLPIGATVTDLRLKRRIGYWNGKGLSQELPLAAASPSAPAGDSPATSWIVYVVAGLVLVAALSMAARRWQR